MIDLSIDRLKSVLSYDPETGIFIWIAKTSSRGNRIRIGNQAGVIGPTGYILIGIDKQRFGAHRLAVFYMTGAMPVNVVDHIDGCQSNNAYKNLRVITHRENIENRNRPNKNGSTGFLGTHFCKQTGRFVASITVNRRRINLGRFDTPEQAHEIYLDAKRHFHKGNTL